MKDFLFGFCFLFFLTESVVLSVYNRNDLPSTKPPFQAEELPWLTFFDRKLSSDNFARRGQIQRKNEDLVSHYTLCPPGETGQFPYAPDCKRFINCWKGRGSIQVCAPGTLFNSETLECDFPGKVKCEENFDSLPMPTKERYVRFPHERPQILQNPRTARTNQEDVKPVSMPAKPFSGSSDSQPPVRPRSQARGGEVKPQCILGATGLYPHPYDCSKFLKCWSGNTFIQNCGPGTFFNPLISACDHPRNVDCAHEENFQWVGPGKDKIPDEDYQVPEESIRYEQYQGVDKGVKAPGIKGDTKTVKHDPDSPNYKNDSQAASSTPQSEAEAIEIPAESEADVTHRKPKVINIRGSQNEHAKGHDEELASYLTPPQYDVYGNIIDSNNRNLTKLGVQPGQSGHPNNSKVQAKNYSTLPHLINYPPQGPYSALQPENQKKVQQNDRNFYGYILNKKAHPVHSQRPGHPQLNGHLHHPVHPAHPHHPRTELPTWLIPPPFQFQFFPQYAPYHSFFPQTNIKTPQSGLSPYYSQHCIDESYCSIDKSDNQESNVPRCDPGTTFYKPSTFPQSTQKLTFQSKHSQQSGNVKSSESFHPNPDAHHTIVKPSSENHSKPDYTSQVQIDLNPKRPNNAFYPSTPTDNSNPSENTPDHLSFNPQSLKQNENSKLSPFLQQPNSLDSTKQISQTKPQYQHYLFYYNPFNANLQPFYGTGSYPYQNFNSQTFPDSPNQPQVSLNSPRYLQTPPNTPTYSWPFVYYPQQPKTDSHPEQSTVSDSFANVSSQYKPGQPDDTNRGFVRPIEVPDLPSNNNYNPRPDSYKPGDKKNPLYKPVDVKLKRPGGQIGMPDLFDDSDKAEDDGMYGTPYYPSHLSKETPIYSPDIKSAEQPKYKVTLSPFSDTTDKPRFENIKTKNRTTENLYLLDNIDVRTGEENEGSEDAENITTIQPPEQKKNSEGVEDQTLFRPSHIHPDKYTRLSTANRPTRPLPQIKKPHVKVKPTPPNGQIARLRNGASHLDGYLEMKDAKSKWGLTCDRSGQWGIAEATVACRELGFIRGAELSWQGYPIKSDSEKIHVAVNGINCTGKETSLSECEVSHDGENQCDVGRNAVGLRCFDNLASHCQPGEILYNQHCYKLHGKENPDDPWIRMEEASRICKKFGGKLVDITTQYENDFLSEWIIKKHPDVIAVATGGIGISVLGRPMWIWEGTNDPMVYERWWSGWSGDQPIPKGSIDGPLCIVLRKTFSCFDEDDSAGTENQKNLEPTKDEETCSADYFFWDAEDCEQLRTSVFICERPMDDIGCVVGNGEGYVGTANTTASGLPCLPWDHPKVVEGLARRVIRQERSSKLVGHNYCRNLGNPDRHPWCFVEGRQNSEYCAIPQCWDVGKE